MPARHYAALFPALLFVAGLASAHSAGPIASHTGAPAIQNKPAENTCATRGCHSGGPLNTNGTLEILGIPKAYTAGDTYEVTVRLASEATANFPGKRWGFELTAVFDASGDGAGTFDAGGLRVISGFALLGSRRYVTHNFLNLQAGEPSPAEWTFSWTAPASGSGGVTFYAAGNAANGSGNVSGDFIYTGSSSTTESLAPVNAATWGQIKAAWAVE